MLSIREKRALNKEEKGPLEGRKGPAIKKKWALNKGEKCPLLGRKGPSKRE